MNKQNENRPPLSRGLKKSNSINSQISLTSFGFHPFFEAYFSEYSGQEYSVGRVAVENKNNYLLYTEFGELLAEISGKMFYNIEENLTSERFPAVGDWVVFKAIKEEKKAIIENILPRRTKFSRKVPGTKTDEQVIASNIDILFIMTSLNMDLNLRRIERYLTLAWDSGAEPVIILSKSDLCKNVKELFSEVEGISNGVLVHIISSINKEGLDYIRQYFKGYKTVAIVGSSGVGKSTLINALLGYERLKVNEIIDYKDKGVHTTVRRELIVLPNGGLIIDTPGLRELQLWDGSEGVSSAFEDIEELVRKCKFSDCNHESEPGCAVNEALVNGSLNKARYNSYLKLKREASYFERRHNQKAMIAETQKWKKIHKQAKEQMKMKGR